MRAEEFIKEHKTGQSEEQLDEIVQAVIPALAAVGRLGVQGAMKGAQLLGQGAKAVGNVASKGVQTVAKTVAAKLANPGEGGQGQAAVGTSGPGQSVQKTQDPAAQQASQQQVQQQKQQQQQQVQQQQANVANLDKIAAQIVALKQELTKQQAQ